jgi:hypothetical protein
VPPTRFRICTVQFFCLSVRPTSLSILFTLFYSTLPCSAPFFSTVLTSPIRFVFRFRTLYTSPQPNYPTATSTFFSLHFYFSRILRYILVYIHTHVCTNIHCFVYSLTSPSARQPVVRAAATVTVLGFSVVAWLCLA